jgi:hypothetical protein
MDVVDFSGIMVKCSHLVPRVLGSTPGLGISKDLFLAWKPESEINANKLHSLVTTQVLRSQ